MATDVIAAGLPQAPQAVIAAALRGEITREQAERLVGHVMIQACGASQEFWASKPHTARRREAELRAIGVAVDGLAWDASVCFPLGRILRGVRQAWAGSVDATTPFQQVGTKCATLAPIQPQPAGQQDDADTNGHGAQESAHGNGFAESEDEEDVCR